MRKLIRDRKHFKTKLKSPRGRRSRLYLFPIKVMQSSPPSEEAMQARLPFEETCTYSEGNSQPDGHTQEVSMSTPRNQLAYTNEFVGDLHGSIEPVPVRVKTMVRVTSDDLSSEIQMYDRGNQAPQYIFGCGGALPLKPALQATGRHYIKW